MSRRTIRAYCPRCGRADICITSHRYDNHATTLRGTEICRMSGQHVPITGDDEAAFDSRAHLVASLACQLRDDDPSITWDYLTALPVDEIQRLLMVALAGIPTDQPIRRIFRWVADLPAAREVA